MKPLDFEQILAPFISKLTSLAQITLFALFVAALVFVIIKPYLFAYFGVSWKEGRTISSSIAEMVYILVMFIGVKLFIL